MKSGMRSVSSRWTYVMLALVLIGLMAPAALANETAKVTEGPAGPGGENTEAGSSALFLSTTLGVLMCMMAAVPAAFNKLGSD